MSLNGVSEQSSPTYALSDIADFVHAMSLQKEQYQQTVRNFSPAKQQKFKQFVGEIRQITARGIEKAEAVTLIYNRESLLTEKAELLSQQKSYLNQASSQLAPRLASLTCSAAASPASASSSSIRVPQYRK